MAKENTMPARLIAGQKTLLPRDVHDIRYDPVHDEFVVPNSPAQAVMVFRGGANGEEPPIRVIQGPHTQLVGSGEGSLLDRLDIDVVHNEIFLPSQDAIFVFARDANGDVPPLRVIRGPDTQMKYLSAVVVDPVHDLIIVANAADPWDPIAGGLNAPRFVQRSGLGSLLVFNRTDNGNVKPLRVIEGPNSRVFRINQMQVYPPKGWIIGSHPGGANTWAPKNAYVGVWSINDNGDIPPRFVLSGPKTTIKRPRGVAIDPKHKEVFIADMSLNEVLTFYWPEIF